MDRLHVLGNLRRLGQRRVLLGLDGCQHVAEVCCPVAFSVPECHAMTHHAANLIEPAARDLVMPPARASFLSFWLRCTAPQFVPARVAMASRPISEYDPVAALLVRPPDASRLPSSVRGCCFVASLRARLGS